MVTVKFEVKDSKLLAQLANIHFAFDRPAGLYDEIGMALVAATQNRFEKEIDPDGNPWPVSLRAAYSGGKTLTDTARLRGSITHEATDSGVAVGTNLIYAAIHQMGGRITAKTKRGLRFRALGNGGWVNKQSVDIPRRAFLGLDAEDEKEIADIVGDWAKDAEKFR